MTYAWFVLFQRCASHRTMRMSYRSKTYTWNDVILIKRIIVSHSGCYVTWYLCGQLHPNIISQMTRDRTRTMVLRNSWSIQKHLIGTGCELSNCDMRASGCALCVIALRSHLTNLFLRVTVWPHVVWRSDVTSCDGLTSRRGTFWRHVSPVHPQP